MQKNPFKEYPYSKNIENGKTETRHLSVAYKYMHAVHYLLLKALWLHTIGICNVFVKMENENRSNMSETVFLCIHMCVGVLYMYIYMCYLM